MPTTEKFVTDLLQKAAPERRADLESMLRRLSPAFVLDRTSDSILFTATPSNNRILVGLKCLARLQVHSLAAAVTLSAYRPGDQDFQKRRLTADRLLSWAVAQDLQPRLKNEGIDVMEVLPGAEENLPPELYKSLDAWQKVIGGGIFNYALAFIVLHELGHLNNGHIACRGEDSVEQEKDADRFAADWLIEGAKNDATRLSMLLGMMIALLWLTVLEIFTGDDGGDSHPEGYERLYLVLSRFVDSSNLAEFNIIWNFTYLVLGRHMIAAGLDFDHPESDDPQEGVKYLISVIEKRGIDLRSA